MKIRPADINGASGWCVDFGTRDGARRRKYFLDIRDAEKALKEGMKAAKEVGRRWADLPPVQRADLVSILAEMEAKGLTLRTVWAGYQTGGAAPVAAGKTLSAAIDDLIKAKTGANRRANYLTSLEGYLRRFAQGRESTPLTAVSFAAVEEFVGAIKSASSRATTLSRIGTLFSFAVRRGWISANPCDRMERPHVETGVPEILTVDEAKRVLNFTREKMPRFLPWLALALFAGVRPEEIDRLVWSAVRLDEGLVTIDAPGSKTRTRRIVHLKPVAVAWLKLGGDIAMPHVTRRRCLRRLRELLGWAQWKKDCLRHSAASYWLASDPDAGKVALELGNSAGVLMKHYRSLVKDADAKTFWKLTPDVCGKEEA